MNKIFVAAQLSHSTLPLISKTQIYLLWNKRRHYEYNESVINDYFRKFTDLDIVCQSVEE